MQRFLQLVFMLGVGWLLACSTEPAPASKAAAPLVQGSQKVPAQTGVLALLFDLPTAGQPDDNAAPVVRQPRRVKFIDPAILEQERYLALLKERANAPPPANWAEMFKRLPKDDEDNIDWMAALKEKIIDPASSLDPDDKKLPPKPMDMDVEISTSGKPDRLVVFPHSVHTQWLVCDNCHPAIFEQEAGSAKITMAAINEGKFCGVCHDAVAVAQPSGCLGCHKVKTAAKKP